MGPPDPRSGISPSVAALNVLDGVLYLGGSFHFPAPLIVTNIVGYDGSNWLAIPSVSQPVTALSEFHGNLEAGTADSGLRPALTSLVLQLAGTEWLPLGALLRPSAGTINCLYSDTNYLYATGGFRSADGAPVAGVARWDGAAWSALPGDFIEGSRAITGYGDELFISTSIQPLMGWGVNGIMQNDGTGWRPLGAGIVNQNLFFINAILPVNPGILVGGSFDGESAALWTGDRWLKRSAPAPLKDTINALSASDRVYAAGNNGVLAYDGTNWMSVGERSPASALCLAQRGNELFAGHSLGLACLTDTNWMDLGIAGATRALALLGKDLFAGGSFTNAGGKSIVNLARWDGNDWFPVGGPLNGSVLALATFGKTLYVGGQFNSAGGLPVRCLAIWDGNQWSTPPTDLLDPAQAVYCLQTAPDGSLFVGGDLRPYGNISPLFIAKWDGSLWTALGDGVTSTARAFAIDAADLYLAGDFNMAGTHSSVGFARWHISDPLLTPSVAGPESAAVGSVIRYTLAVQNVSTQSMAGCTLNATIPDGTTFVSSSSDTSPAKGILTAFLGTLDPNSSASITLDVRITTRDPFIVLDDLSVSTASGQLFRAKAVYTSTIASAVKAQTITFPQPSTSFGFHPIQLIATASSGLPVQFEILSGGATLAGGTLIPATNGPVSIRATQPGDSTYAAATPVDQTISIYALPQIAVSVIADQLTFQWSDQYTPFTLEAAPTIQGPWQALAAPTHTGTELLLSVPSVGPQMFFRLHLP